LKQERGAQIEAIRSEVFATYASKQGSDSSLVATAMGAAAASLGGLGGLGPSTSNPEVDPSAIKAEEEEEEEKDETVPEAPKPAADLSLKKSTGEPASSSSADSPSRPPHDEEDSQTSTSSSKSIADPIVQTGVGAAARGLGGVGGLGQSNSEQEEEGASSSEPSQISSADLAKDPIVQTAIGAAALGLGGVGGLGRSSSEPSPSPGDEEEGSSGKVLPMGIVGATPAQVSRALKVQNVLIYGYCHEMANAFWPVHPVALHQASKRECDPWTLEQTNERNIRMHPYECTWILCPSHSWNCPWLPILWVKTFLWHSSHGMVCSHNWRRPHRKKEEGRRKKVRRRRVTSWTSIKWTTGTCNAECITGISTITKLTYYIIVLTQLCNNIIIWYLILLHNCVTLLFWFYMYYITIITCINNNLQHCYTVMLAGSCISGD